MKNLHIAGICGHFAFGTELFDGQTIKTKIIAGELEKQLGADDVCCVDTYGGAKRLPLITPKYIGLFLKCKNIIILPAQNGLKFFVPLSVLLNILFRRKLHYVVIGGWLAEYLDAHRFIARLLKRFDNIYVETSTMKKALEKMGFKNTVVMPNCKKLAVLDEKELVYPSGTPLKLCTFSRVMKEKGIEDAVCAVIQANELLGYTAFALDIYGQIDANQTEWFENLQNNFPKYVSYGGKVPFDKSVDILKNYFALLFPTYYDGEGFAGTLIDAFSAGVPVIASDWKYNAEIVNEKVGIVYPAKDRQALTDILMAVSRSPEQLTKRKKECLEETKKYKIEDTVKILVDKLQNNER